MSLSFVCSLYTQITTECVFVSFPTNTLRVYKEGVPHCRPASTHSQSFFKTPTHNSPFNTHRSPSQEPPQERSPSKNSRRSATDSIEDTHKTSYKTCTTTVLLFDQTLSSVVKHYSANTMKFVYTALISCIALSALSAADRCVSCVANEGARNVISSGIQYQCRRAKGTPYGCNFFGYACDFCRIPDGANTEDIMDYCNSKAYNTFTYNGGPKSVGFVMRSWNLANCK